MTKLKNSNCAKLKKINCDNSKTQIVMVIKMTVVTEVAIMTTFSKNTFPNSVLNIIIHIKHKQKHKSCVKANKLHTYKPS